VLRDFGWGYDRWGQKRPNCDFRVESGRPSTADIGRRGKQVSSVPILLQKSVAGFGEQ